MQLEKVPFSFFSYLVLVWGLVGLGWGGEGVEGWGWRCLAWVFFFFCFGFILALCKLVPASIIYYKAFPRQRFGKHAYAQ